jgi:hypothetical protein
MERQYFYNIDVRCFPKVRINFNSSQPLNMEEFQTFLNDMTQLYLRQQRFSILFDTRKMSMLPLKYLKGISNWMKKYREEAKRYLEKTAILVSSSTVRFFMKSLFLIVPPSAPNQVCGTLRQAVEYLDWIKES